jgi:hypothetical protein
MCVAPPVDSGDNLLDRLSAEAIQEFKKLAEMAKIEMQDDVGWNRDCELHLVDFEFANLAQLQPIA